MIQQRFYLFVPYKYNPIVAATEQILCSNRFFAENIYIKENICWSQL